MKRFLMYFEVLIAMSICRLFSVITKELTYLGNTAEFYSKHDCHFWQQRKVLTIYNSIQKKLMNQKLKELNKHE